MTAKQKILKLSKKLRVLRQALDVNNVKDKKARELFICKNINNEFIIK
tara:strand:- start:1656 stop:1799 length:144 start_codon:yes stop_codon:yes gene_type:complete